ncbi:MAG: hypothetical protein R3189_02075 [Thiomicrorhabdus chilensis]|uniref:hypothetical protein n=1 Tax=Thiomicrorhabdus chilensis TaxID=63656 RepID=UPI00299D39EB|nr:hypothetical protein [Thiomicrorhabdus chilensis]MDX1347017.1 hypothetical protein [Thiomicrorhabdus chilensis]
MATVSSLQPKVTSESEPTESVLHKVPSDSGKVVEFHSRELDMMPGDWAETGNPTPYELRVTLQTCKRLWQLNQEALQHPDCDHQITQQNIKVLERMYIVLMDYLVE